jgi:hypothetical protein
MSLESRIRELERKRNSKDQSHTHWMVPNPHGGMMAPNPKDCETCQASNYKNRFIILFNMRNKNLIEPSHVRV